MSIGCAAKKRLTLRPGILAVILVSFLVTGHPAWSQQTDIRTIPPNPASAGDALTQAFTNADMLLNDGLTTMNESTLRRAAMSYEQIIRDYPNDPRHFNAYFNAAYVYMEYLQSSSDYEHASNLLSLLIANHPSNYPEINDAHILLAHLYYRCLRNYRAAQEHLSTVLNNTFLASELGSREPEVKMLLAKCRQKLAEYDKAQALWEEIYLSNPELDTEGRLDWIRDSGSWFVINDGLVRLFFYNTIDRSKYTSCLSGVRDGLAMAESTWGLMPDGTVDVYLYSSSDQLFDFTMHNKGFALPVDNEIYLSTADLDSIAHLTGWLTAQRINTRPEGTVFPLLRAGFCHYFMGSRSDIDSLAAREIYYYGGTINEMELLFPMSYDYTFSEEYQAIASSFMHYLIEEGRLSVESLEKFYRLMWANPRARMQAPLITELMRLNPNLSATSWQENLITPEQVFDLFRTVLGVDLQAEMDAWQDGLQDEIARVRAELGSFSDSTQRVNVDLSSPEAALETWWNAYRAGDLDALIRASTREMAQFLIEARDYYEEQGILDQVIVDNFIRPYRNASMVVVQSGTFADNLFAFQVRIEKGDDVEEMTIVVRLEDGLWKVDSN